MTYNPGLFDRAIAAISPGWALSRAVARVQYDGMRGYQAGETGRRMRNWRSDGASGATETRARGRLMRERARWLVQNNPWAASGLDKVVGFNVGTGIVPRSATGDAAMDKAANDLWAEWGRTCDWHGRADIYAIQAAAERCRVESGEVLLQWHPMRVGMMRDRGARIPLAISVKEPDYLDDSLMGQAKSGNRIDQGIEFDRNDQRTAYWMFPGHPGDVNTFGRYSMGSQGVDAAQVMHVYKPLRAGDIRGVTAFAPAMLRLKMLEDLEDADLEAARVQASLAAFVTSQARPASAPLAGTTDPESGEKRLTFRPGMIERLHPGETITMNDPKGNGAVDPATKRQLRAVAETLGLTYDLLTGDLSSANFSSLRAGRLTVRRNTERMQWGTLIPQMCDPIWSRVMDFAQALGLLPNIGGPWPVKWGPPRFEMLDPGAEMKALKEAVRDGFYTMPQALAELGWDPAGQIDEIAEWNAKLDASEVILDTDPRHIAGSSGTAQASEPGTSVALT